MPALRRTLALCLGLTFVAVPACKKKEVPAPVGSSAAPSKPVAVAPPALAAPTPPTAPVVAPAAKSPVLAALSKRYLDGLFRAKPHLATFMGEHRYDGDLPDFSPAALAAREAELAQQQKDALAIDEKTLSMDDQIDSSILRDGLALELLYLREIKDWTWDPRLYDSFPFYDPRELLGGRMSDIIHGTFAPEAVRRASIVGQLEKLPAFLATIKSVTANPPKVYLEQAVQDNKGRFEFFEKEVGVFVKGDAKGEKANAAAIVALRDFQVFLEKELPSRPPRDWRLGDALYRKKFPLALQTRKTPEEVMPIARAAFDKARRELYESACKLHASLWPKESAPAPTADAKLQAATIRKVRDEIAKDHAQPAELVAAHARRLEALRAFIEQKDLLALPPKETLRVEPMPAFKRGSSAAEYLAPGVLDRATTWKATYYVDPIDPTWKPERVESYLRGQNDYAVELVAAHEAYPGHHTQAWYSRRDQSDLRAVLWSGPMAEGWACYAEELLVKLGYGGERNERYRFSDLQGQLILATNILIDIGLQTGKMRGADAVKLMVEEGYQEKAMAEKKLVRAKLDSTQLAQYFLGYSEILELEGDYRKKVGPAFKQRAFNEALISHGTIGIGHLRRYVLQQ